MKEIIYLTSYEKKKRFGVLLTLMILDYIVVNFIDLRKYNFKIEIFLMFLPLILIGISELLSRSFNFYTWIHTKILLMLHQPNKGKVISLRSVKRGNRASEWNELIPLIEVESKTFEANSFVNFAPEPGALVMIVEHNGRHWITQIL